MVYPRISLDIPSFLKPDFSAGSCCGWSQSIRTRLWVIKSVLLHAPPWQLCQGKRWPTKGSLLLLLARPGRLALRPLGGRLGRSRFLSTRLRCVVVVVIVDASASAAAAARASCLAALRSRTSCLVSDGLTVQDLQDW